jgi:hypothetical protein
MGPKNSKDRNHGGKTANRKRRKFPVLLIIAACAGGHLLSTYR